MRINGSWNRDACRLFACERSLSFLIQYHRGRLSSGRRVHVYDDTMDHGDVEARPMQFGHVRTTVACLKSRIGSAVKTRSHFPTLMERSFRNFIRFDRFRGHSDVMDRPECF